MLNEDKRMKNDLTGLTMKLWKFWNNKLGDMDVNPCPAE